MIPLFENWVAIGVIATITIAAFRFTNTRIDKLEAKIDKLYDLMIKYIINPTDAKKEAADDVAKQKTKNPNPPKE